MAKTRRAEDFSNRDFVLLELRIPEQIFKMLEDLARYRGQAVDNMALNMLIEELDGELHSNEEMGMMISKHLRGKYQFREADK